ncbi:glycosyltransferase [Paenibacillus sp. IHBB 10380]|uniref:glycosyltransferase n=1 Tax=Paenibacillus sp. IHBB 10380 TaxID=1566358 RepID=UPI0005CFD187|nr:glycosyltransferase [Paenibacillus sp. IHBB 10380]AJS60370.1 family 2 glycosyl transferase [Paenibacillus sp. IHBB 10380]
MNKTICLCMIVKNEEKYLRRCLDSVKDKVDQIVIVDTGSIDATLDIAAEYTKNIFHFTWIDDFAAARNESIKHATSDYILVLDADEYLIASGDLQKEISSSSDYYFVKIHNLLSQGRAINHISIRLFANHKGLIYRNRLHEHLNTMDENAGYKGTFGELLIYHTGYTDQMMKDRQKEKRNLPLMLKEVNENPNAYNLFNMGRTYMWTGEHEKAISYFQRAYPLSTNLIIIPELLTTLCYCLGELNRYEDALQVINDAVNIYPNETDLRHMQGILFIESGYTKDAVVALEECLKLGDQGITVTEGNGSYTARFRLAELYESQNRILKSYEQIVKALQDKKSFAPGLKKYFEIVTKANIPLEDVYENIEQLYNVSSVDDLELLLEVLYALRHPLLNKYLTMYKVNVQANVIASAQQYDKQYMEAKSTWLHADEIESENGKDILLLSLLLQDDQLLQLSKPLLNVSEKECKVLQKIICNVDIKATKLTPYLENMLVEMSVHLLVLQEYEVFQRILDYVWLGSLETKYNVSCNLISYGFNEIAIDLLVKLYEKHPNNVKIIRLLGDTCMNCNYLQDAQLFYTKLLQICPEYSSYERCYELYEKLEDNDGGNIIIERIKDKFQLSMWVKG